MNIMIKNTAIYILLLSVLAGCSGGDRAPRALISKEVGDSISLPPFKDQGHTELCWIYAALTAIEADRISQGDSVCLSPAWVLRSMLRKSASDTYFSHRRVNLRGTLPMAMSLIEEYGVVPYDSYRMPASPGLSSSALARKATHLARTFATQQKGFSAFQDALEGLMDSQIGAAPLKVYMFGSEYTPEEFARSVAMPGEWQPYSSFTHHPFGEAFDPELRDNQWHQKVMNVPLDSLLLITIRNLEHHHPVMWEGCMRWAHGDKHSNRGIKIGDCQTERQQDFEHHRLTDDHCMAIIGIKRVGGQRMFVCQNSWKGSEILLMSERQFLLNTIMVMVKESPIAPPILVG